MEGTADALRIPVRPILIRQITRDLGDAPDSSNHFPAVTMSAYVSPSVQANYPTVHDPSLGVPGPEHRHPRPFHLGRAVSWEAEADIGPDLDFVNNRIGTLAPQTGGRIVIVTKVTQEITELSRLTNVAHISADDDVDESNNTARASVAVGVTPPYILYPGNGTICENEVTVIGTSLPNAEITLYVNGTETTTTTASYDGQWRTTIHVEDGEHTLYATATVAGITSPSSQETLVIVDSMLAWSPASLRFQSEHGRIRRPVDDDGRTDVDGWRINLRPHTVYTVTVDLCCESENAVVTLNMEGLDEPLGLTDPDGDNTYSAQFRTGPRILSQTALH